MDFNQTKIIGHIANDFEVRTTPSWTKVTDVILFAKNLITTNSWEEKLIPSYTTVTLWWNLADIIEKYTSKWSQIFVSWRLETDSWEWEDWKKKYKTRVIAEGLDLLSKPESDSIPEWFDSVTSWLNQAEVIWNVTSDLELKETSSGFKVLSFSVATNRKWKWNDWELKTSAQFHNVVLWNKLAEDFAQIAKKWKKVYVSWQVSTRSWEWQDWEKRYTTEIVWVSAKALSFLSSEWQFEWWNTVSAKKEEPKKESTPSVDIPEVDYSTDIKAEDLPF